MVRDQNIPRHDLRKRVYRGIFFFISSLFSGRAKYMRVLLPPKKRLLILLFLSIISVNLSCEHTAQPPNDCTPPLPTETTSHNFIWRLDTLGAGNGSVLNDVAILNDTLAYAVGEIYLKDSTGQFDPQAYNASKWNGKNWELKRIPFIGSCSAVLYPPIKAIWTFSDNSILLTNGGSIVNYDGVNATMDCRMNSLLTGAINKIHAFNTQDVYAVGNKGTIVHFSGSTWQKLESGTTIDIVDIWGAVNCRGETEILAVASRGIQVPPAKTLLRIQGTAVSAVSDSGLPLPLQSIWFAPLQQYFIGGDGLYRTNSIGSSWQRAVQLNHYVFSVRGLAANDIVVAGGFGGVSHFNGATWQQYMGSELPQLNGNYYAAAIHPRLVAAVGGIVGGKAIALIGKR
jgi:hypothetical protein